MALALDAERAPAIEQRLLEWKDAGEDLHAPSLFRFEVANALTRNIAAGKIDAADAKVAWQRIVAIEISLHGDTWSTATSAPGLSPRREDDMAQPTANAVAESFFATLKKELVHRRSWPTRRELQSAVFDYIESFYNRERRHSTLGYLSPREFEMIPIDQESEDGKVKASGY